MDSCLPVSSVDVKRHDCITADDIGDKSIPVFLPFSATFIRPVLSGRKFGCLIQKAETDVAKVMIRKSDCRVTLCLMPLLQNYFIANLVSPYLL